MGANSKIEWTDATWNPTLGCSRVSEGCRNCYAEGNADDMVRGQRQLVQLDGTHFNKLFLEDVPAGAQWMERQGKKDAGSLLDGQEHKAFPEVLDARA